MCMYRCNKTWKKEEKWCWPPVSLTEAVVPSFAIVLYCTFPWQSLSYSSLPFLRHRRLQQLTVNKSSIRPAEIRVNSFKGGAVIQREMQLRGCCGLFGWECLGIRNHSRSVGEKPDQPDPLRLQGWLANSQWSSHLLGHCCPRRRWGVCGLVSQRYILTKPQLNTRWGITQPLVFQNMCFPRSTWRIVFSGQAPVGSVAASSGAFRIACSLEPCILP